MSFSTERDARTYTTDAFCLKTYPVGEADKLLVLFSTDRGKVRAMAKGARRKNSQLAGCGEAMAVSRYHLARGRNLETLSQHETIETFPALRNDLLKLAYASLFAEQILIIGTEEDVNSPEIFALLRHTLTGLSDNLSSDAFLQATEGFQASLPPTDLQTVAIATHFQLSLLEIAGYQPLLDTCVLCSSQVDFSEAWYPFSVSHGGICCPQCYFPEKTVPVSTATLQALTSQMSQTDQTGQIPSSQAWAAANPLKTQKFLEYYFSNKLEKKLNAYDFVFPFLETENSVAPSP